MVLEFSERAENELAALQKTPQLVLEIEGVSTLYGALPVRKRIQIGDPGLEIGGGWVIGGLSEIPGSLSIISMTDGTTTSITQQLEPDKGAVSSIQSMRIALVDRNGAATQLVSPGVIVDDILGRRCKVWLGFDQTAFKDDFTIIHRGVIDEISSEQGIVVLNISHPDKKKTQDVFIKAESKITVVISNVGTPATITLESTANFLTTVLGPNGLTDPDFNTYVRINDEVFKYTGISGNTLTGISRGQFTTPQATHSIGDGAASFYVVEGQMIDLALKLMLSGVEDYFIESVDVNAFNQISPSENISNTIFLYGQDSDRDYGLVIGDYITTTGATNGANNVTLKQISDIEIRDLGTILTIDGVSFVTESGSPATVSFRSQYDVWPEGAGLGMFPDEVDVQKHIDLFNLFLSAINYRFYLDDTVVGKDLLHEQIYLPSATYSTPAKSRSSLQYHIGPIPGGDLQVFSKSNINSPSKLKVKRSTGKNFSNTIITQFDRRLLETDKFDSITINVSNTSKAQIPIGTKSLKMKALGYRTDLQGASLANIANARKLRRYEFGAESVEEIEVRYGDGIKTEVGDIVLLDGTDLNLINTADGTRAYEPRLMEVTNKKLDLKGKVTLSLTDTNFDTQNRYGLVSPSSEVASGASTTKFTIKKSYGGSRFGSNEFKKWNRYEGAKVIVRNADFTVVSSPVSISDIDFNTITVSGSLGFIPSAGMIMELAKYNFQSSQIKLIYAFMTDAVAFDDGEPQFFIL